MEVLIRASRGTNSEEERDLVKRANANKCLLKQSSKHRQRTLISRLLRGASDKEEKRKNLSPAQLEEKPDSRNGNARTQSSELRIQHSKEGTSELNHRCEWRICVARKEPKRHQGEDTTVRRSVNLAAGGRSEIKHPHVRKRVKISYHGRKCKR